MNKMEFAEGMLRLQKLELEARELKEKLAEYVLAKGESITVGACTAKHLNPRRVFDYESAAKEVATPEIIEANTTTIIKVDWRKVCEDTRIIDDIKGVIPEGKTPHVKFNFDFD